MYRYIEISRFYDDMGKHQNSFVPMFTLRSTYIEFITGTYRPTKISKHVFTVKLCLPLEMLVPTLNNIYICVFQKFCSGNINIHLYS